MPAPDEQLLIHHAQEGQHGAFRQLVERYMKAAYNVAFRFVNSHELAEDITQEAFLKAYHGLRRYRGEAEFSTWLYRIVTNLSLNTIKREQRRLKREAVATDADVVHPEVSGTNGELVDHLERALHELPTMQRAVVILRHLDGLSTRQVSGILSCSEGTVKTHLFRGLKKLKKKLVYLQDELE